MARSPGWPAKRIGGSITKRVPAAGVAGALLRGPAAPRRIPPSGTERVERGTRESHARHSGSQAPLEKTRSWHSESQAPPEKSQAWYSREPRSAGWDPRSAGEDPASGLGEPAAGGKASELVLGRVAGGSFCPVRMASRMRGRGLFEPLVVLVRPRWVIPSVRFRQLAKISQRPSVGLRPEAVIQHFVYWRSNCRLERITGPLHPPEVKFSIEANRRPKDRDLWIMVGQFDELGGVLV